MTADQKLIAASWELLRAGERAAWVANAETGRAPLDAYAAFHGGPTPTRDYLTVLIAETWTADAAPALARPADAETVYAVYVWGARRVRDIPRSYTLDARGTDQALSLLGRAADLAHSAGSQIELDGAREIAQLGAEMIDRYAVPDRDRIQQQLAYLAQA